MRAVLVFGFLGAGKTTLLSHWLAGERPDARPDAMIVNEFGALGLDGPRLERGGIEMVELSGGCICCELRGPLDAAVDALAGAGAETLWIEASGVARPQEVLAGLGARCSVEAAVTVVDAARFAALRRGLGPFYADQIRGAGAAVVNKIDLAPARELDAVRAAVADLNPGAAVLFAERGEVDRALLSRPPPGAGGHVHRHLEVDSCVVETAPLSRAAAERAFAGLPGAVWRAKGHMRIDGAPCRVDWVPGQLDVVPEKEPRFPRMVFIGANVDRAALERAFAGARRARGA